MPPRGDRYTTVAIALHWTIATLMIVNIAIGLLHDDIPKPLAGQLMWWHKSAGIAVLLLTIFRLFWRVFHKPPPLPAAMPAWEVWSARATHWGFYALMLALPFSGWVFSSSSLRNAPIPFFGLNWPYLPVHSLDPDRRKAITGAWHDYHGWLGWIAVAIIVLHVAAALKHWLVNKDNVMRHMIPALKEQHPVAKAPGKTAA